MEIEVFNEILGENLGPIPGQDRYYNSLSDSECFYEIPEWLMTQVTTKGQSLDFMIY